MADIFLSYKRPDFPRLAPIIQGLQAHGFTVWWDQDIEAGDQWFERILREIDNARCIIGVWSAHSIDASGQFTRNDDGRSYVRIEHNKAMKPRPRLLPVLIDQDRSALEFDHLQVIDLCDWTGQPGHTGWTRLLRRVEELATPEWIQLRSAKQQARLDHLMEQANYADRQAAAQKVELEASAERERTAQQQLQVAEQKTNSLAEQVRLLQQELQKQASLADELSEWRAIAERQRIAEEHFRDSLLKNAALEEDNQSIQSLLDNLAARLQTATHYVENTQRQYDLALQREEAMRLDLLKAQHSATTEISDLRARDRTLQEAVDSYQARMAWLETTQTLSESERQELRNLRISMPIDHKMHAAEIEKHKQRILKLMALCISFAITVLLLLIW